MSLALSAAAPVMPRGGALRRLSDLLYTRQLLELERANHQAQLDRVAAAARVLAADG